MVAAYVDAHSPKYRLFSIAMAAVLWFYVQQVMNQLVPFCVGRPISTHRVVERQGICDSGKSDTYVPCCRV